MLHSVFIWFFVQENIGLDPQIMKICQISLPRPNWGWGGGGVKVYEKRPHTLGYWIDDNLVTDIDFIHLSAILIASVA